MEGKFKDNLERIKLGSSESKEIQLMINTAGEEFPCLSCPSKDECTTFKWFIKWFGEIDQKQP